MSTPTTSRPTAVPWPPLLIVAVVVGGWVAGLLYPLRWPGLDDLAARIVGYGLGAAGIALMAWGLLTLRQGGPPSSRTGAPTGSSRMAHSPGGAIPSTWGTC
jgi:hypothetical protein